MTEPRITYNGTLVLQALARGLRYGFEIMDLTGLASGTVYPILRRYEHGGLVSSDWEEADAAHGEGRPRRRYYRLTTEGEAAVARALDRLREHQRIFADAPLSGSR